jgi:asparagine synthase (glutamine-hydrolysing)
MCGIYGELVLAPNRQIGAFGQEATDRLRHRGPDDRGTWSSQDVFLGVRRLSVIDAAGGGQPIWNCDRTACIVYNGELYNFRQLRRELEAKGHAFRTRCDTEVVLRAYEAWGLRCFERLNGMFAFAIWDGRDRTLLLARDRVGEKPLYYFLDDRRLVFASEIKAILADPSVPRSVNLSGLVNYLAIGHAIAPQTICQDIHKLMPGHYLLAGGGRVQLGQYWDVGVEPEEGPERPVGAAEDARRIRALLDDSVRRRLVADAPVGAFLSGGVDSSAIVALMRRHADDPVQTFSLGFDVGGAYDELDDARAVAQHLGTEHRELRVCAQELVDAVGALVYHYDEPFGDSAGFPVYLLSRFARAHVKVVLTGDGGDELFGGYRRYVADQLAVIWKLLPGPLAARLIPGLVRPLPRLHRAKRLVQTLAHRDPVRRCAAWLEVFDARLRSELLAGDVRASVAGHDPFAAWSRHYDHLKGAAAGDHLNRMMYVDLKTHLVDAYMEKTDKATMACGLEARQPFLDHRLVELAFRIPSRRKIRGTTTKRVLKEAVADLVPVSVLRKRKHGFAVPTDPWFRGELKSFTFEILHDERTRRRGLLDPAVVERLWKEHAAGRHVWSEQLWLLLCLELWQREFLDRSAA